MDHEQRYLWFVKLRGYFFRTFLLALSLTLLSVAYHRHSWTFCYNLLGAGFPIPFACDQTAGSPIRGWGKMDWSDITEVRLHLFFVVLLWHLVLSAGLIGLGRALRRPASSEITRSSVGQRLRVPLGLLILATLSALMGQIIDTAEWRWRSIAMPPVPTQALQVETGYVATEEMGGPPRYWEDHIINYNLNYELRATWFRTGQSVEEVQGWYRRELAQRSWRYRCTVTAADLPCGVQALAEPQSILEVFERGSFGRTGWHTLEVLIGGDSLDATRSVLVVEHQPRPLSPYHSSRVYADNALIGEWQPVGSQGKLLLLQITVLREAHVVVAAGRWSGRSSGADTHARLTLDLWDFYPQSGLTCDDFSALLPGICAHIGTIEDGNIDFDLTLASDTLTLTHGPTGLSQTFRRVNAAPQPRP